MSGTATQQFSAADSALGYLYQVRVSLLWSLQRLKTGTDFVVSLETLDDVAFEGKGEPAELLQTKHHRSREATLTDGSVDLWKSLRIWFEGCLNGTIPNGASLFLLTTATAPSGSAASKLRNYGRDVDAATAALLAVARTSENKALSAAHQSFLKASLQECKSILESVTIIDSAPHVDDLDQAIKTEVFWASERKFHEPFLERLEGWWLRRCLRQLISLPKCDRILAVELEAAMSDLREQFKQDALPIDEDLLNLILDEATLTAHSGSTFVRQLQIINAGKKRIAAAIRDYYRAFEQRSRWLRNDLLLVGDLATYEQRLIEEWELIFESVKDELGPDVADLAKEQAAREILKWAERTSIPIRPNVTEPFVTRGSLHMLADELRIGWHPEFQLRLAQLLGAREVPT